MITWTISSAWTNAYYTFTCLIETPGNNVFTSHFKVQTAYLTIGPNNDITGRNDIFSIIVDAILLSNVFIFAAKIIVELSIGVNKITNIVEMVNLTLLLFTFFIGFTLQGLTYIQQIKPFEEKS